jgi:tryptophan synthase alpha chain
VSGAILPDLPLDEAAEWFAAADPAGIETVMLVAPNTRDDRLALLCERARGFVYGVATLGVTGERASLASTAARVGDRLKAATDKPVLLGIGISNASQAVEASAHADGVILGAAVMRRVLEGESPAAVAAFLAEIRSALDS